MPCPMSMCVVVRLLLGFNLQIQRQVTAVEVPTCKCRCKSHYRDRPSMGVSQKDIEKKVGKIAEQTAETTTHIFTSGKFLAILAALIAVAVGLGYTYPEEFKARFAPAWAALIGDKQFEFPSLPDGFPKLDIFQRDDNSSMIGQMLREEGLRPKYPFIIVPGFVTSGLELWHGEECAKKFFRQRMWAGGNFGMARTLFYNIDCWLKHMALDPETGLDVPGINLRAAHGLEAVDYFVPGYAVWAKLIQALADLGYDSNNLVGLTYDWRLAVPNLEIRDKYHSRLKNSIEEFVRIHNEKVLVASHSWGDNVFRAFMQWVDSFDDTWVDRHIAVYINLSGPVLGVTKSIPAFLSGETRDTADMGFMSQFLGNKLVPATRRAALFRTWGAGIGMLPVGGPAIWGNKSWAPDDTDEMREKNETFGKFLTVVEVTEEAAKKAESWRWSIQDFATKWLQETKNAEDQKNVTHHDVHEAAQVLMDYAGPTFERQSQSWSASLPNDAPCTPLDGKDPLHYFHDPFKCPLPKAPKLHMYCLYGTGKPVERAYQYLHKPGPKAKEQEDKFKKAKDDKSEWEIHIKQDDNGWTNGVRLGDGDGTVPLISLGLQCRKGWRQPRLNPSGIRVRQREYVHQPVHPLQDIRGGPRSSDHVDVLGNVDVMEDVLRIAAGQVLDDNITSMIDTIAKRVTLPGDEPQKSWSIL